VVKVPTGPAPQKLVIKDLIVGQGPVIQAGQHLSVQYVGVNYADGKQFDASWDNGSALPVVLGQNPPQVIQGWEQGMLGMRVGGRRELIIPPSLGYGSTGSGTSVKPNETLVFVIDLLSAQ
jgi:peptidylprolyl isomerase